LSHASSDNITDGLDFILSHFEEPIWPRTISTHTTKGRFTHSHLDTRNVIAVHSQTHKANFYTHNYGLAAWLERENSRSQIEWRRTKVAELDSQGHSQPEISRILQVSIGTVNRDLSILSQRAS
jgi:DNA-binding NarL/FixJ family response regulator